MNGYQTTRSEILAEEFYTLTIKAKSMRVRFCP